MNLANGLNISNIGNKIRYTETATNDFIPINMRLGTALGAAIDDYNKLSFAIDINKLLSDIGTVEGYLSTSTLKNNQTYFGFSNIVDSAYKILYLKNEPNVVMKNLLT